MKTQVTNNQISGTWMSAPEVRAITNALGTDVCRFVGGVVRDTLLGKLVNDIDMATTLDPTEVSARLEQSGIRALPTGIAHGTITAVCNHFAIEITTLRHDVATDGRHADVAFHTDWEADAARRDFTINALYADSEGNLFDYFGGVDDLAAGRVRFIGDARARIDEDALRILRFFRFHAWYGRGELDPAGATACELDAEKLGILSIERVRDELLKILASDDPLPVLEVMAGAGILDRILPLEANRSGLAKLVAIEKTLGTPDPLRRLCALLNLDVKAAGEIAAHFRLSSAQKRRLEAMVATGYDIGAEATFRNIRAATYWLGAETVRDRAILSGARSDAGAVKEIISVAEAFERQDLPVTGNDLLALGANAGPELGLLLQGLEETWVESDFRLGRDDLLQKAAIAFEA